MRRLVAESSLGVDDLVAPLFVREGIDGRRPIPSLPGVVQHTVASLVLEAKRLASLGVPALVLFGVPTARTLSARAPRTPTASSRSRSESCAPRSATSSC